MLNLLLGFLNVAADRVPTSITDWCISGLTRSVSTALPFSMISADVRAQIAGLRVDGLILFLDPDGEAGLCIPA